MRSQGTFSVRLRQKGILPVLSYLFFAVLLFSTLAGSAQTDTTETDTTDIELPFPFNDKSGPGNEGENTSGLYLNEPANIQGEYIYDPKTDTYIYQQKMGDRNYRPPEYMSLEEYKSYDMEKSRRDFFREKSKEDDVGSNAFRPKLYVESKAFDRIFGGNTIDIRPQGSAELTFGVNTTRRDNPAFPENQRRTTNFDFDEKIQLNVVGSVGDKLKISTSYNTEATFDFENQTKIEYTGYEDEIIQKIELGNVALPLQGTLIQGSQTLFGIKTELKFGRMRVTSIFSQERGERKEVNVSGGSQTQEFELSASEYEDFQHYFLSHYFRDRYNEALADLPNIVSAFTITRVDVWVTRTGGQLQNARNVVAFTDLGESNPDKITSTAVAGTNQEIADNYLSNNLYNILTSDMSPLTPNERNALRDFNGAPQILVARLGMENGPDFEAFEGVLLQPSEYVINNQLGYISLSRKLNPEDVMGVAYEYRLNGRTFRVGEMSNNAGELQKAIYVKLLKSNITNTDIPMWDLMMKNVYYLNSFGISREDFRFEIWYLNQEQGVELPFIAEGPINGELLLQVMELDNLDPYNAKHEDGEFDYLEGITINPSRGRVYFPIVEPFGEHLREKLGRPDLGDKYAFDSLYSTTKALAQLDAPKNRFTIKGTFKSSSGSEISLGSFNVPQGSVVVTAGGQKLVENVDYTVDYNLGRVKILNTGLLESNANIKVSFENNSLFNIQTRTLMGSRIDYDFSENLKVGGTVLNLTERPLTYKVNIGNEAISNTIVGVDGSYATDAPILTKIADALPFYDTKEKSTVNTSAEFAYLIPGNARAITKDGVAYIDDFEGSQYEVDMKLISSWRLASTPRGQDDLFREGNNALDDLSYGYNRANLAWYVIDPLFFNPSDRRLPGNITGEMQQNHYMRQVLQQEIFPNKSLDATLIGNIQVLDLYFDPRKRGPYNFDPLNGSVYSAGLDPATGQLNDPESRWGGIMRDIQTVDFEATNIEFLQFWVMDPFVDQDYREIFNEAPGSGGELYFNFGEVAEDILKDNRKSYENGFPFPGNVQPVDTTIWGNVPVNKSVVQAFDNAQNARPYQDIGYDGLRDDEERVFHEPYLQSLSGLPQPVLQTFIDDPSGDNFRYFRDEVDSRNENVVQRYEKYNGVDGNSPVGGGTFVASSTTIPDIEDINRDNTMNTKEAYYQYRIPINPSVFDPDNVGQNYVTDYIEATAPSGRTVGWYQFKIPLRQPDEKIGQLADFKSIRFMRMLMKGFDKPVVMRFAKLELIRGEWRRYFGDLRDDGDYIQGEPEETEFTINAVNVEENSNRIPVNYVLPPGIEREVDYGTANLQQLNEQSLALHACNLNDGSTKAAYRNLGIDIRQYKKLKMYVHLEDGNDEQHLNPLRYGEISLILRMGADFEENYYEYEIPLLPTEWGANARDAVWPELNNIELALDEFANVKLNRDANGVSKAELYSERRGDRTIRVKGTPNIATVKVMMIGVKNPKAGTNPTLYDDGMTKCATVWVNELRVSDFDNKGGWATTASVSANLADLATVRLTGNMSTPGFGSINQKLNERQQLTKQAYEFSSNVELGKFTYGTFTIPMYFRYGESWEKPRYVPLNPDIELEDINNSSEFTRDEKDSIRKSSYTYLNSRSLNFTNVRLNYPQGNQKQHIYDIQNWSVTYAYNLDKYRDVNLEYRNQKEQRGQLNWGYSAKPHKHQPFNRSKWLKSKHLKIIKDFNFFLAPKQYAFSTTVERGYNEKKLRQTNPFYNPRPYYQKQFNWNRSYMLKHDFTEKLKFTYDATNNGFIRETEGKVDRSDTGYTRWRDTVLQSISELGTNLRFNQNLTLEYTLPLNKFPWIDWTNTSVSYNAGYYWDRAAIGSERFGNSIRNSGATRVSENLNMNMLYNKVDYLKRLADSERGRNKGQILKRKQKKEPPGETGIPENTNKIGEEEQDNSKKREREKEKEKKKKERYRNLNPVDYLARLGTSIKEISGSYTNSTGTVVPGYGQQTSMLGFDERWSAPGLPFILGQKMDTNYVIQANNNGWLVANNYNYRYNFQNSQGDNYTYRISIRPINNLRIELNGNYNYNIAENMGYTWSDSVFDANGNQYSGYQFDQAIQTGSFSVSTITYRTAFEKFDRTDYSSPSFEAFNTFRPQASGKLADERLLEDPSYVKAADSVPGYFAQYGPTQQDVLISSFVSAYRGDKEVKTSYLDFKKLIPLPNWSVNYDGLGKLKFLQKWFQSIIMRHAYRSNYNVGSFTTNNLVQDGSDSLVLRDVATGNFISEYQISTVSITEQFSPFFKIDFNFKNGLLLGYEFKRDRNISLSTVNNQISEVRGREHIVSIGYTFRNVRITFTKNKKADPKNIVTRIDVSSRDNYTIIRSIGAVDNSQPGNGQNVLSIKFTADLAVSPKFNIRGFYDRIVTKPFVSNQFPTASSNYGISLRFSLAN